MGYVGELFGELFGDAVFCERFLVGFLGDSIRRDWFLVKYSIV